MASSSLVSRSIYFVDGNNGSRLDNCRCGSVVEHFLGKEEVVSSILINGSKTSKRLEKASGKKKKCLELGGLSRLI